MLNYEVEPDVLAPFVPAGTELDAWEGRALVSVVGFLFLGTRVMGVGIPFHRDFEELNLRFYVRRLVAGELRRGVVFVKEIVPRLAIAATARLLYGENYVALPMSHRLGSPLPDGATPGRVEYAWGQRRESSVVLSPGSPYAPLVPGSEAEFVTEHYWGYARQRGGATVEYRVEHPPWRVARADSARLDCDVAALYGERFREGLSAAPVSSFLADGSEVAVHHGTPLAS